MAYTGQDSYKHWQSTSGLLFSNFFQVGAELNSLYKEALYIGIERRCAQETRQQGKDDLFSLVTLDTAFAPTSNQIVLQTTLTNYLHTRAVKTFFEEPLNNLTVLGATNSNPITVTVDKYNKLRTGSLVNITTILGNTNANALAYLKRRNERQFQLYQDEFFQSPVTGSAAYTSGGKIAYVHKNWAKPIDSNQRIAQASKATPQNPRYDIGNGALTLYPLEYNCFLCAVDYVKKPTVFIDTTDNIFDLETVYPQRFLYFIEDILTEIVMDSQRDWGESEAAQKQQMMP